MTYKPVEETVEAVEKMFEPVREEVTDLVHKGEEAFDDAKVRGEKAVRQWVPKARKQVLKVVDDQFDMLEKLLKTQRKYTHTAINTFFDVLAPKAAPKKAAAKKPVAAKPRKPAAAA